MEFKDIASVSGKGGLFKIVSPTRSGVILESLDKYKKRFTAGAFNKISVLEEISLYTNSSKGSEPLKDILQTIYKEFGDDPGVESGSSGNEYKAFLKHILPAYDESRVYVSDIKKVISWYNILLNEAPELLKSNPDKKDKSDSEPEIDDESK